MAAVLQSKIITNGLVSINGTPIWGSVANVTLDSIKAKTAEYSSLGSLGTPEYFLGIEKMGGKMELNFVDTGFMRLFGDMMTPVQMQVRTNMETQTSSGRTAQVPLVYKLLITPTQVPGIELKPQEKSSFEMMFSMSAITIEENSVEIFHFDAISNTYRVNGVDKLVTYKANIGQ